MTTECTKVKYRRNILRNNYKKFEGHCKKTHRHRKGHKNRDIENLNATSSKMNEKIKHS